MSSNDSSSVRRPRRMRICLSVDFDAISAYLGTGHTPQNTLSDYSAGHLSANVGVPRLLKVFAKYNISNKVTWFIPGHSAETFPSQTADIVASGAEIGLHGYSHEGAYAMTPQQEEDVLDRCIEIATQLRKGKKPAGYRAPLYQIRESTVKLLQQKGLVYDSSMNAHDSLPYYLPTPFLDKPPHVPDYSQPAASWMKPTTITPQPSPGSESARTGLVEIPTSWYTEDETPLGFFPYSVSSHGYVSTDVVEKMWMDRFTWIWENESFVDHSNEPTYAYGSIFSMIWHPESAGRAHVIGMIDRVIGRLVQEAAQAEAGEITFETMEEVAQSYRNRLA